MAVLSSAVLLVLLAQPWQADAVRSPWDLGKLVLTMTAQSHEGNQASASAVLTPAPVTVPFDKKLQLGSKALPLNHPRMVRRVGGIQPDQIHITYWKEDSVTVTWVTGEPQMAPHVRKVSHHTVKSFVQYGKDSNDLKDEAKGHQDSYKQVYEGFQGALSYASGLIHHVKLKHLTPGHTYFYRCGDPAFPDQWSQVMNLTMPRATGPHQFPLRLGIIADIGQTMNSSVTLDHLISSDPALVMLVGDLTYADDHLLNDSSTIDLNPGSWWEGPSVTYQPRWDTWGRFMEPLASRVPLMTTSGNHEMEPQSDGTMFAAYTARYPVPHKRSGSSSNLWYSFDVAAVHMVVLTPYAGYERDSKQYRWLERDLADFDREVTPWLVVSFHAPWYNTLAAHYQENECMRQEMEHLLHYYGADIVLQGHVHSYERSNPVYNYKLDDCGTVYLNVGDGGNIEKLYKDYVDQPDFCPEPKRGQCVTLVEGEFCLNKQPEWSAYREASFGHGTLDFINSTHTLWNWHRNQDGEAIASDTTYIVRRSNRCRNKRPMARYTA